MIATVHLIVHICAKKHIGRKKMLKLKNCFKKPLVNENVRSFSEKFYF